LAPGGLVVLEIGFGQAQAVEQLLTETGFTEIELAQDLQGIPRVVTAHRS
jgi:release factor glutamine methyltransferase